MQASAGVFILGIVATFISMLLYFPLWHFGFFIAGAVLAVISGELNGERRVYTKQSRSVLGAGTL